MQTIQCQATIVNIGAWAVVRLPREASDRLSSRGMVMILGTINELPLSTSIEPDGEGGHWFKLTDELIKTGKLKTGDSVELIFEQTDNWPEPVMPRDFVDALDSEPLALLTWQKTTTRAKWEWLRWIRSTRKDQTRKKRILTAIDKLQHGEKRPCCFNSAMCTVPFVSHNGVLLDQT